MTKTFIITGASRGLGKALKDFIIANSEHSVISISRNTESSDISNDRIDFISFDLSDIKSIRRVENFFDSKSSREFVFINNAAVLEPLKRIGEMSKSEISYHLQVNITSSITLINFLINRFPTRLSTIINISSGASLNPISHWSLYCASKAALNMFCKVLAKEYPLINVRNIDPGVLDTDMQKVIRNSEILDVDNFRLLESNEDLINGDVLLMNMAKYTGCHVGVYVGEQMVLHHQVGRLSSRDLLDEQMYKSIYKRYRHVEKN